MTDLKQPFEEWCVLELMGHRRLAGRVTEAEIGGAKFLRLDVPGENGAFKATQYYSPAAVYCITPTTEVIAREVSKRAVFQPVQQWELPSGAAAEELPF